MRASDPAGYEGMEKLVSTATGRAILLTASGSGTITLDIETNEVASISRDYENGTTTVTKKILEDVVFHVAANSTILLPIVGKYTLVAVSNGVTGYVLR